MAGWTLERRHVERFKAGWTGELTCYFPDREVNTEVKVLDISSLGARLELKTLEVGTYNIVIGSESTRFTLKVSLPEAVLSIPLKIVWYSTGRERDAFNLGVVFIETSKQVQRTIEELFTAVAPGTAYSKGWE